MYAHAYIHTHTHTNTLNYVRTYIYIHTYTHTIICGSPLLESAFSAGYSCYLIHCFTRGMREQNEDREE